MSYFQSTFASSIAVARSLAFAAGLTSLGGCASAGFLPPTDQPGLTILPAGPDLGATLEATIERDYRVADIHVDVRDSFRTDFDGDGLQNDTAGTALLRNDRRFKNFIFLMRDDGATRFLEANGGRFHPETGGSLLNCGTRAHLCPDTFERARRQIDPARLRLADLDTTQPGPELSFAYDDGSRGILNALRLFRSE
jgi:hypothetical protein